MTNCLVTGGTGFVGAAVVRCLLREGFHLRVLVRPASGREHRADARVSYVEGDLRDPDSLVRALKDCDALFHVAADYRLWCREPEVIYESNVAGTENIMRAALREGVRRIVHTSSVATLGHNDDGQPADEETTASLEEMVGDYKRSKYLAEARVVELVREEGLPAVIVNPSTPVGPGDWKPTPTGRFIRDAVLGKMPAYIDTGLNIVHVEDVAEGHLLAFRNGTVGRRYILGGENMTLREILEQLSAEAGIQAPRIRLPRVPLYPVALAAEMWGWALKRTPLLTMDELRMAARPMYFQSLRARTELGYNPRPAADAFTAAARWFLGDRP